MTPHRLAVIGAGHLGRIHARLAAASQYFNLVAVVDPIEAVRDGLTSELGVTALDDFHALLGHIDAAVVATPTRFHHAVARELLREGVHVLVEKPLAATCAEADELVSTAAGAGAILQVGHIERFNPALAAAAEHVVGPKYIEARRYSGYTFRSTDIGVVLDLMIHDLDVVLSLVDSPIVRVDAMGLAVLGPHEDVATVRLGFANGCVANLSASRVSHKSCREMQVWSPSGFVGIDFAQRTAKVVRPAETLLRGQFDPDALLPEEKTALRDRLLSDLLPVETTIAPERNALADELDDFATSISTGRPPRVTGEQGRDALAVAERILEAIARHAWDGHPDERVGPLAALSAPTLRGPHWPAVAPQSVPRRQAG